MFSADRADSVALSCLCRGKPDPTLSMPVKVVFPFCREKLDCPEEPGGIPGLEGILDIKIGKTSVKEICLPAEFGRGMRVGIRYQGDSV